MEHTVLVKYAVSSISVVILQIKVTSVYIRGNDCLDYWLYVLIAHILCAKNNSA